MKSLLLLFSFFAFQQATFSQQIIYVNQAAQGAANGTSWADAYTHLQYALIEAEAGDEIWVAKGTYKPPLPVDPDNRLIFFYLVSGVKMYGGFSGVETSLAERDWNTNITRLSGELGQPDQIADNSSHVILGIGLDSSTVIDGFTISDGAGKNELTNIYGGGMLLTNNFEHLTCSLTIENCVFENNYAYLGGAIAWQPGAFGSEAKVFPVLKNCIFRNNIASFAAGAVYLRVYTSHEEVLKFDHCVFENNITADPLDEEPLTGISGGILLTSSGYDNNMNMVFSDCVFKHNIGGIWGGALEIECYNDLDTFSLKLERCTFSENASECGSAIYVNGDFTFGVRETIYDFSDCTFERNLETDSIYSQSNIKLISQPLDTNSKATFRIDRCRFADNLCTGDCNLLNASVGKIDFDVNVTNSIIKGNAGGGLGFSNSNTATDTNTIRLNLSNSLIYNNGSTGVGTGINLFQSSFSKKRITNCTFYNNNSFGFFQQHTVPGYTGLNHFDTTIIENCIIWNPALPADRLFRSIANLLADTLPNMYGFSIKNCLIAGDSAALFQIPGSELAFGAGNIFNRFPEFADTLTGNFQINTCSPAMNSGDNTAVLTANDLAGLPRIAYTTVDMGAYEQQDSCVTVTAKPDSGPSPLRIFPNPVFDGQLNITLPQAEGNSGILTIFGSTGQLVYQQQIASSQEIRAACNLPAGMYLVRVVCGYRQFVGKVFFD